VLQCVSNYGPSTQTRGWTSEHSGKFTFDGGGWKKNRSGHEELPQILQGTEHRHTVDSLQTVQQSISHGLQPEGTLKVSGKVMLNRFG